MAAGQSLRRQQRAWRGVALADTSIIQAPRDVAKDLTCSDISELGVTARCNNPQKVKKCRTSHKGLDNWRDIEIYLRITKHRDVTEYGIL